MKWLYHELDIEKLEDKHLREHIYALLRQNDDVNSYYLYDYFGGCVGIVEEQEDLKQIHPTWANLLEGPGSYDWCMWVCEERYVELCLCTTNAGGDVFFIPKDYVNEHVLKSIELS